MDGFEQTSQQRRVYRNAELVAKFYKYIEVISSKKSNGGSSPKNVKKNYKFEPKDFTQVSKSTLDFINNCQLGEQQLIMFHEKEIQEKLKSLQNQVFQQSETTIMKQKEKLYREIHMSIIPEEDIE